ncbi:hypothetical protein GW17_00029363 [Ensete ventricosum]|nr:hypothetical protein GW17_00029363 [Ensete ventricosum]
MAYAAGAWAGGRSEGGESEKVGSFGATLQSLSPLCSDASLLKEEICCTRSYGGRARGRWLKCRGPGRGYCFLLTARCLDVIIVGGVDEPGVGSTYTPLQSPFQDTMPRRRCPSQSRAPFLP